MAWELVRALYSNLIGAAGGGSAHTYDTPPDDDDTTLTGGAGADTFGSYAQIASTVGSSDVWLCGTYISNASAQTDFKVETATGAAASEVARATMPYTAVQADTPGAFSLPYPIRIPNGTRLAARSKQGDTAARTIDVVAIVATGLQG